MYLRARSHLLATRGGAHGLAKNPRSPFESIASPAYPMGSVPVGPIRKYQGYFESLDTPSPLRWCRVRQNNCHRKKVGSCSWGSTSPCSSLGEEEARWASLTQHSPIRLIRSNGGADSIGTPWALCSSWIWQKNCHGRISSSWYPIWLRVLQMTKSSPSGLFRHLAVPPRDNIPC